MKKIVALLLPACLMVFLSSCGNPYVKTISTNSDTIVKQVATPHDNVFKVDGDGAFSWFDVTPKDFFEKYKAKNTSMEGLKLTTAKTKLGDSYGIDAGSAGASITLAYISNSEYDKYQNCISKIEASASGDTQEEANANGKFIDSLIRVFNSDDAETIEKELYIFETPPAGTQFERDVVCGNVEYYFFKFRTVLYSTGYCKYVGK